MISAYAIGQKVYLVSTAKAADPEIPRTLPIGSPALIGSEARDLAAQLLAAADAADQRIGRPTPKVKL